jgi:hypothetical protein
MRYQFEASKFLSQINKNSSTKLSKIKNHKYIIKINELQQIIRFINSHKQKTYERMDEQNKKENQLISIEYLEFYDFLDELNEELLDFVYSVDEYDIDFINTKLELILSNNYPKNSATYYIMADLVKSDGYYLSPTFVKYFID